MLWRHPCCQLHHRPSVSYAAACNLANCFLPTCGLYFDFDKRAFSFSVIVGAAPITAGPFKSITGWSPLRTFPRRARMRARRDGSRRLSLRLIVWFFLDGKKFTQIKHLVGAVGFELTTFALRVRCSTTELHPYEVFWWRHGDSNPRTLPVKSRMLCQLSYTAVVML
jgi:hypothetical protein